MFFVINHVIDKNSFKVAYKNKFTKMKQILNNFNGWYGVSKEDFIL